MRKIILFFILFTTTPLLFYAQSTAINDDGSAPHTSAMLHVQSTSKGLLIPRMTTAQRNLISSPAEGLMLYDTSEDAFYFRRSGSWQKLVDNGLWKDHSNGIYYDGGGVGLNTTPASNHVLNIDGDAAGALNLENAGTGSNFTLRAANPAGTATAAAFFTGSIVAGYPSTPAGLYAKGDGDYYGAFITSTGSFPGVLAQSQGTGPALDAWSFGTGLAGLFRGGDVQMQDNLQVDDLVGVGNEPSSTFRFRVEAGSTGSDRYAGYFINNYTGASTKYGVYSFLSADGTGSRYGLYGAVTANSTDPSASYAVRAYVNSNNSPGNTYGVYSSILTSGTGTHYGIWSSATGSANYAGYFVGRGYFSDDVGIGTTSPAQRLHVNGTSYFDGSVGIGNSNPQAQLQVDDTDATGYALRIRVGTATKLLVYDNGGTSIGSNYTSPPDNGLYIAGNVHVGYTGSAATAYKMAVNGKIIAEEVRVENSTSWPDYVFQEDYALMPLDDLEASIQANRHLPGIPSAKEVEEEGILLGDMQKRMMEKIEELTLYVIDLNKEVKALKAENAELKARLD